MAHKSIGALTWAMRERIQPQLPKAYKDYELKFTLNDQGDGHFYLMKGIQVVILHQFKESELDSFIDSLQKNELELKDEAGKFKFKIKVKAKISTANTSANTVSNMFDH